MGVSVEQRTVGVVTGGFEAAGIWASECQSAVAPVVITFTVAKLVEFAGSEMDLAQSLVAGVVGGAITGWPAGLCTLVLFIVGERCRPR